MKRKLILFTFTFILGVGFVGMVGLAYPIEGGSTDKELAAKEEAVLKDPLKLSVILQKQYIDGKIEETSHTETIWAMQDFWAFYDGWEVVNQGKGEVTFRKEIRDISPYLKENGYFGLQNGQLTIFEGRPMDEQVIQTFYHIDTKKLETYQLQQLNNGIKIDSKDVYQYVLEAFRGMSPSRSVTS
ncbi:intercompartmental signaling factor BofC [Aquibacillus sp. 3ASR75-11]|uniref:Intercompartmental signaling factor BofC n=1 Tax=Terrihalobacillus insolitus TaxID=2950438 RepID=A0A9X4AMV1_9BACI|nr:BofC C-terminal domain-containing protein [Terrihalobacillus insolitus]MDC3412445.1 intercompartmental signaling factor BofC [Terrihalobacillus insolitus]MDC3423865.1 intercompartmental signaling factor BofC [Terrihalobacillus insolitus]